MTKEFKDFLNFHGYLFNNNYGRLSRNEYVGIAKILMSRPELN